MNPATSGKYLLDASALLALIRNEPGADRVRGILDESQIHAVNLAEVARKVVQKGISAADVEAYLGALSLEVLEVLSTRQALEIGRLGMEARRLGLSIGDCVHLAVAQSTGQLRLRRNGVGQIFQIST